jgi:hypothetical protein
VVSQDVKFDEDVWSSRSQVSPSMIEGSEEVVVPEFDSEVREESDPGVGKGELKEGYALTLYFSHAGSQDGLLRHCRMHKSM